MAATHPDSATRLVPTPLLTSWGQSVLILFVAVIAYFQTWIDIWPYWENKNATYTHGTLIAAVTLWLIWRSRPDVNRQRASSDSCGLVATMLLSTASVFAQKANLFIVHATLWPLLALAALWAALGLNVAARLAFPLAFLYFAIPVWEVLKPPLQAITTTMAGLLTSILGIPAAFDGPYVTLPTGTIFIAEDCSGAHFLAVALAVGALAGVFRNDDIRTRVVILIIAGLLSMAFNWVRILLIALAYLHPDLKEVFETMGHLTFGWWVFALDLVVFALVLRLVPRSSDSNSTPPADVDNTSARFGSPNGVITAIVSLLLLPLISWALPRFDNYQSDSAFDEESVTIPYSQQIAADLRWAPHFPGKAWEQRYAVKVDDALAIEVYRNYYHEQSQASELISRGTYLFDPMIFSVTAEDTLRFRNSKGREKLAIQTTLIDADGTNWLSIHTYSVNDDPFYSRMEAKFVTALQSIYSRPTSGIISVALSCATDCEAENHAAVEAFTLQVEEPITLVE